MKKTKEPLSEGEQQQRTVVFRGWIIVSAIALVFVIYGLFAFFVIGDNQPPEWDFGAMKDTPGESVYSTYPYRDRTEEPEPQHINQKPPNAAGDASEQAPPVPLNGKLKPDNLKHEPESRQHSVQQGPQPGQPRTK